MEEKNYSNSVIRYVLIAVHCISIIAFLITIVTIYQNSNFKTGLKQFNEERYEDSIGFRQQFDSDVRMVFDYVNYKEAFETNDVLDYDKEILFINGGPNTDILFTVDSLLQEAEDRGYEIDDKFNIVKVPDQLSDPRFESYSTNWCSYKEDYEEESKTVDQYIEEVVGLLRRYYQGYTRLMVEPSNFRFALDYPNIHLSNDDGLSAENAFAYGIYAYTSDKSEKIESNYMPVPTKMKELSRSSLYCYDGVYSAVIALDTNYPEKDIYQLNKSKYNLQREIYFRCLVIAAASAIIAILSLLALLLRLIKGYDDTRLGKSISESSFEGRIVVCALGIIVALFLNEKVFIRVMHTVTPYVYWEFAEKVMGYACIYGCVVVTAFTVLDSLKRGTLWQTSFLKRCYDAVDKYIGDHSFTKRSFIEIVAYILINSALMGSAVLVAAHAETLVDRFIAIGLVLAFTAFNLYVIFNKYKRDVQQDKIADVIEKLACGETDLKLSLEHFDSKEADMAENLNNISSGFQTALDEKMKSERMKTDLITNVSHDIRTPLTSIINYVDLIKREKPEDPKIVEYLEVLEQKSQHLKNLTEDLLEVSKVSSGTVNLDLVDIDFAELVQQANGEFEEKFSTRGLQIVAKLPAVPVIIKADGASLWRVLENIYNNAFKYALEDSRVYIEMTVTEDETEFVIKNVSANPLNISADELTERFVRGDVSRNSEGSGLGLSIAQSLTRLQGGEFEIQIDGDLFKAFVRFGIKKKIDETGEDMP